MSSKDNINGVEDIWTKLQKLRKVSEKTGETKESEAANNAAGADSNNESSSLTVNQQIIFVGDAGSGKSTLIQTFIKPNAVKDTKPTVALEYNFARKTVNNTKYVANLWEVGGDFLESKYLEIPLTKDSLKSSAIVICCDLSKPHNVIVSVLRSLSAIREILKRTLADLQSTNVHALNEIKDSIAQTYKGHPDANKVKPLELPIVIIGNKYDTMRTMTIAERRAVLQALRFVSHYFGAIFMTVSVNDGNARELFRSLMNSLSFNVPLKPSNESNVDKYVYITRAQDTYESILLGNLANETAESAKYRMVNNEAEMDQYITQKGVTRDCWNRLTDHFANMFGECDPLPSLSLNEQKEMESGDNDANQEDANNPFPEVEVDDMRAVRDLALQRYIQEMERKQEMLAKMNAQSSK